MPKIQKDVAQSAPMSHTLIENNLSHNASCCLSGNAFLKPE
ncbi:hypothetical protein [Thiolapillus sp.]|nr:hypothetical protein [Thiolapillus sp.]